MPILRRIIRNPLSYSFIPYFINHGDKVSKDIQTVKNADLNNNETGLDRLKNMFTVDEFENISPEVSSILQVGCMSIFIGALYGGVLNSRTAYMDFMKNNQASVFRDHLEAKKKLQDKVTLSFGKGAFRWAWRLSLFSTTYMTVSTTISVYRGKFGVIEHVAAGATAGFLYKFPTGPRAWVVGAALGSVLGAIAGTVTYGLLTLTGSSWDEVRYWQYKWKENRLSQYKAAIDTQKHKDELYLSHNSKMKESGKGLTTIDVDDNAESTK